MTRLAALVTAAVLVMAPNAAAVAEAARAPSTPAQVRAYVQPSLVQLRVHWEGYVWDTVRKEYVRGGRPFEVDTQCTGYVVNPHGYIATAGHCVDPDGAVYRAIAERAARRQTAGSRYPAGVSAADVIPTLRVEGYDTSGGGPDRTVSAAWGVPVGGMSAGRPYLARVLAYRSVDRGDAAVLKVGGAAGLPALVLAGARPVDDGTRVVSVSYSGSVEPGPGRAALASARAGTLRSPTGQGASGAGYEISPATAVGAAGGPTIGPSGDVVGFAGAGVGERQPDLVRPAAAVSRLLAAVGVPNRRDADARAYQTGLEAYFAGDRATAVARLRTVVESGPPNAMAAVYLSKARLLEEPATIPAPSDDAGEVPLVMVALGSGGATLLLALGGLVLVRRLRGGLG